MPDEYWRWRMVMETGWTLDQVDALTVEQWHEYLQYRDGLAKAGLAK